MVVLAVVVMPLCVGRRHADSDKSGQNKRENSSFKLHGVSPSLGCANPTLRSTS